MKPTAGRIRPLASLGEELARDVVEDAVFDVRHCYWGADLGGDRELSGGAIVIRGGDVEFVHEVEAIVETVDLVDIGAVKAE
jgi:hypothetical protein